MKLRDLKPRYKTYEISVLKDGEVGMMGIMRKTIADNIYGGYEVIKTYFLDDARIQHVLLRRPKEN